MSNNKINLQFIIVALMIVVAAISRLIPHPPNFTPIGGMALFGAAYFAKKYWAFIIPIFALWFSDLLMNNTIYSQYYEGFTWFGYINMWVYIPMILITLFGIQFLKKIKPIKLIGAAFAASIIFFLVSNFGVWMTGLTYPKTFAGLIACYGAGIPFISNFNGAEHFFFLNTVAGDLFYTAALFGSYELIKSIALKPATSVA